MNNDSAVLTTGEVAKICNVAPRTVSKWFDTGALKGYRIPGSKDRRIPLKELVRFMKAHGIPTDGLETGATRVLIADDDREVCDVLCKAGHDAELAVVCPDCFRPRAGANPAQPAQPGTAPESEANRNRRNRLFGHFPDFHHPDLSFDDLTPRH